MSACEYCRGDINMRGRCVKMHEIDVRARPPTGFSCGVVLQIDTADSNASPHNADAYANTTAV